MDPLTTAITRRARVLRAAGDCLRALAHVIAAPPENEEEINAIKSMVSQFSRCKLSVRANKPGGHWYSWEHCCRSWTSSYTIVSIIQRFYSYPCVSGICGGLIGGRGTQTEQGFGWVICGLTMSALLAVCSVRPDQVCLFLCFFISLFLYSFL